MIGAAYRASAPRLARQDSEWLPPLQPLVLLVCCNIRLLPDIMSMQDTFLALCPTPLVAQPELRDLTLRVLERCQPAILDASTFGNPALSQVLPTLPAHASENDCRAVEQASGRVVRISLNVAACAGRACPTTELRVCCAYCQSATCNERQPGCTAASAADWQFVTRFASLWRWVSSHTSYKKPRGVCPAAATGTRSSRYNVLYAAS